MAAWGRAGSPTTSQPPTRRSSRHSERACRRSSAPPREKRLLSRRLVDALAARRGSVGAEDRAALVAEIIRRRAGRVEVFVDVPGLFGCRRAADCGAGLDGAGAKGIVWRPFRGLRRVLRRLRERQRLLELPHALAKPIALIDELGVIRGEPLQLFLGVARG